MSTVALTDRLSVKVAATADTALSASARLFYLTAVVGQVVFAFAVASFYVSAAVRGNFEAWNRFMPHGYIAGETIGNGVVAAHLTAAVLIILSGAIQLLPQVRRRAPALHRWNGRVYILTAFVVSGAGLFMIWARHGAGDLSQMIGASLNGVLVMVFAAMALRTALARDFRTHRRWALRLFLAAGGVWFIRIGLALSLLLNKGPWGFDPKTFQGPFLTFISFASYLLPLAVLQLYLRAQDRAGAPFRLAMAGGLLALTVAMGVGIFAATLVMWVPRVKAAFDGRRSIDQTLSATIAAEGIDAAVRQYHRLKAAAPAAYDFDERELSVMGRRLIRDQRFEDGLRILQLNAEAYPQSSKVYERLADAYLDHGDTALALDNYRKSLERDPGNGAVAHALLKLNTPH